MNKKRTETRTKKYTETIYGNHGLSQQELMNQLYFLGFNSDEIAHIIRRTLRDNQPILIYTEGDPASGKSTLAAWLGYHGFEYIKIKHNEILTLRVKDWNTIHHNQDKQLKEEPELADLMTRMWKSG